MIKKWLNEFQGTEWKGRGELWLDPEGDTAERFDCSLTFETDSVRYNWLYEGQTKIGSFIFNGSGATWTDSWHQPELAKCREVADTWGLFTIEHSYEVPASPNWGWRSILSKRSDGDLVLQMTNIAAWGEEGRAVRMIFKQVV